MASNKNTEENHKIQDRNAALSALFLAFLGTAILIMGKQVEKEKPALLPQATHVTRPDSSTVLSPSPAK